MSDAGTRLSEREFNRLKKRLQKIYARAGKELQRKLSKHLRRFIAKDIIMRRDRDSGKITKEAYQLWQRGQVFTGKAWRNRIGTLARTMTDINKRAMELLHNGVISVFAHNMNYQNYKLEHDLGIDVGFSVFNPESVSRLIKEDPKILPEWNINEPKDYEWNYRKVNDIVTQAILQGESVQDIADKLGYELKSVNETKMRMFARTAITGAQNAARIESMRKQLELGIHVQKKWIATHDKRTRDTHRYQLDGDIKEVDDPFTVKMNGGSEEIMYPGDPNAVPELVYNCRCTLGYFYPEVKKMQQMRKNEAAKGMTYEQWIEAKENRRYEQGVVK